MSSQVSLQERISVWKGRDLREIVAQYLAPTAKRHFYVCPFHEDVGPSLSVYPTHYHCYACGAHGDVLDFAKNYFKTRTIFESIERLGDVTIIPVRKTPPATYNAVKSEETARMWRIAQRSIQVPVFRAMVEKYLASRALTPNFEHGHIRRRHAGGCVVDYIVMPTYFNGDLVSVQLRAMDSVTDPKYLRYGKSFGYNESNALTSSIESPCLIISAENKAFDVLTVRPYFQAVMGAPAKYLLPGLAKRLVSYGVKRVIIVGDNDKKPQSLQRTMDIVNVLKPVGVTGKVVFPPDPHKDLNDLGRHEQIADFIQSIL